VFNDKALFLNACISAFIRIMRFTLYSNVSVLLCNYRVSCMLLGYAQFIVITIVTACNMFNKDSKIKCFWHCFCVVNILNSLVMCPKATCKITF